MKLRFKGVQKFSHSEITYSEFETRYVWDQVQGHCNDNAFPIFESISSDDSDHSAWWDLNTWRKPDESTLSWTLEKTLQWDHLAFKIHLSLGNEHDHSLHLFNTRHIGMGRNICLV